ncbi:putative thiolase [Mycena galopus ATCC 62051]|nr:putative thiolase [Mycena galopus ATCC 62051]
MGKGRRTFIVGGGCTAFIKPRGTRSTEDMGLEAATKALLDAGITYDAIQTAYVGYCYGDSTCGQRALYNLGLTHIPITNVNNNCSTGIKYGQVECAIALGFEKMKPGCSLGTNFPDRAPPTILLNERTRAIEKENARENHGPGAPRLFSNGAKEYFDKYGGTIEHLAQIASKNHKHSVNNPYSQFRDGWSVEQDFVHAHGLENQAIEIVAQALSTDGPEAFESSSAMEVVGYNMTKVCADQVFRDAGFAEGQGRDQVGVLELHDCFAANELIMYPALGLCGIDEAHKMVERGDNTRRLEAKGHPLGATGLGMHFYIAMQLRDWAGPMQAPGLFDVADARGKYGLVHNVGLGGAVVVSLLRRPEFYKPGGEDGRKRYSPAFCSMPPVTMADVDKVKSKKNSPYILQHAKL